MKKIVFVHLLNDYSGSPKVLSQVINVASLSGMDVHLYTCSGGEGFLDNVNAKRFYFPYKHFNNKLLTLLSFFTSQLFLFFKLLKYRKDPDVVFYINTMLPFGAVLAGRVIGKRVICHIHETSLKPLILKNFLRSIIKISASEVVFVSEYLRSVEDFQELKSTVVYNGIEGQERLCDLKNKNRNFTVLMICSLKSYKGVHEYVGLAKQFEINRSSVAFKLILNATESEVNLFFNGRSLPHNLAILTKQSDMTPYYLDSSLLLNLSRPKEWVETFGLTIVEAMSYGVPVIVPPVGGPAEIVKDGEQGYLIDCAKEEELVKKISNLQDDSYEYDRLSVNAFNRAKDFSLEVFNREIERVIIDKK